MKAIITLAVILMFAGCSGISHNKQIITLPDTLQVGHSILSRDTVEPVDFPTLTNEQCQSLHEQTQREVPKGTQFIGTRTAGNGITLEAYRISTGENPNQFKVYLVTRNGKDRIVDAIDLGEFHTSEHQKPMTFGGNRFYTTDAELRFDGDRLIILHRVMTLTSLYFKGHRLTELWRVEWDNHYEITADGHFTFKGQQETNRSPADINDPTIEEFKSRN